MASTEGANSSWGYGWACSLARSRSRRTTAIAPFGSSVPTPLFAATTIGWIRDPDVTRYLGADFSAATEETERQHLERMLVDEDCYSWMIEHDGRIVGNVELNGIAALSRKYAVRAAGLCIVIGDPRDWGLGLATRSVQAVCAWALASGGFDLVEGKAHARNERSWRALARLGFRDRGVEAGELDGSRIEWRVLALARNDWAELRGGRATRPKVGWAGS